MISNPIAFYASEKWLEKFVYRIEIGPLIFLISGLIVMIIALISTGIRSRQAALTNPAEILRGWLETLFNLSGRYLSTILISLESLYHLKPTLPDK